MSPQPSETARRHLENILALSRDERDSYLDRAFAADVQTKDEVIRLLHELESQHRALGPGEVISARYEIVKAIGRGGMGEVYEAHDRLLNEPVVLKTLRPDLARDPATVKRFQKEIQLARRVTHPNVCRVFEAGIHEFTSG